MSTSRYNISVVDGCHHVVHQDAGGGEDLLQLWLGPQAACRGGEDVENDCVGDGCDGLEGQQYVHCDQTVCWAELVLNSHVGNETF